MADLSESAARHCQDNGFIRNARVLFCGDHFDKEGEYQMQQGLGPTLDRPPVTNTCFWVGRIAGNVDNAGNINVSVHICLAYLVVVIFFGITVSFRLFPKQKKTGSFRL